MTRHATLLVVDDNEPNRDALSRRLRQRDYAVDVASGGAEALSLAGRVVYDLILLDVEMPGMSGLEVLSRLRETRSQTQLPVIMVTARTEGADIVEAFRLGANDYVTKPVDFPVALARIGTHLAHKRAVEDLRESEERYALAMRGANDGLFDWNLATDEVFWSARWKGMLGYEESEIGASPDEWLTRVHPDDIGQVKDALRAHLDGEREYYECEHRILHRDGTFRWVLCRGAVVRNLECTATRLAGSLTDITDGKVADALTGLPNRFLFVDLLDRAIKRAQRRKDYVFALLVLGLDRFRAINDSLGPLTADRLLVAVARRLQASLRATDALTLEDPGFTLARLGSDEFTVLLDDITDASDAIRVSDRLRRALQEPFDVDGHQVFASATVGIAVGTPGHQRPDEILRDAATALNRAKTSGTPSELFDPAMRQRAVFRLQTETDLRNAIDSQALFIHYQPIIALRTGAIVGLEALVRWQHHSRGLVAPVEFIPVAEDIGMIRDIGQLTLAASCRQMVRWEQQFGLTAPATVCVNVSSRQFADADLVNDVERILRETGLPGSSLKLEITESAFIADVDAAQRTLSRMQAMGVRWSLDDFGTGYSSLSYLHRLQVDTVKIDRSFVSRMGLEDNGLEMVRAVISLAHNLGMDVVAEGVETPEQLAQLEALGCDYAQGFYFAKAVDPAQVDVLIACQPWRGSGPARPSEAITADDTLPLTAS